MNVVIKIHYISAENKVLQSGSFPLKRRKPENVAYEFWKQVKRGMPYGGDLEKVTADGIDITALVIELEKAPLD